MTPIRVVGITAGDDMFKIDSPDEARGLALKGFIVAKGWTSWFEKYRDVFEACLPADVAPKEAIIFLGEDSEDDSGNDSGVSVTTDRSIFRAV